MGMPTMVQYLVVDMTYLSLTMHLVTSIHTQILIHTILPLAVVIVTVLAHSWLVATSLLLMMLKYSMR